ncbi:MAG: DUF456 domain-containing protein [bacterium]
MIAVLGWFVFWVVLAVSVPVQLMGLPGIWIIFADALVLRLLAGPEVLSWYVLLVLFSAALVGEVLEFYSTVAGAREKTDLKGIAPAAIVGGILGGIVGAAFLFGLGALPGAAAGSFAGVFILALVSGSKPGEALGIGTGALIGRIKGTAIKLVASVAMIAVLIVSLVRG